MKGILDRFEDNQKAVILLEEINEEWIASIENLPDGSEEGTAFHIEKVDGEFQIIAIDHESTRDKAQQSSDLMEKLRAKSKGSKFRKK
ncbi:hypothetical protein J2Z83_003258 [Virgibacillus natechei]|uniref:DUF3006 domain-containing protein n=1 Tax=Virgibacillus natechei TaxID=1216297 RepID=A0ABS4IJK1_9BACI|nr:DUF3006 domain-containing protein [Virgibacillus natechei]MBP1971119.1 hypothetical protein [Virgibacillus natechei]UZD12195.1 DUF3006 domain-containing protein [Virgibacillus natechei]